MAIPVSLYVSVVLALQGLGVPQAGFGSAMFAYEHAVAGGRLQGPFTSPADVIAAGHVSGSPAHAFATSWTTQPTRGSSFYIGQRLAGDADLTASLDAIELVDPAAFYAVAMESRTDADILDLAAWTETRRKIAMAQTSAESVLDGDGPIHEFTFGGTLDDATYTLTFTGFGLGSPVDIDVVRGSGTPATEDDMAAAMAAALETAADGGSLDGVVVVGESVASGSGGTGTLQLEDGLASGTVTVTSEGSTGTLDVEVIDSDVASSLFASQYTRTALLYYHDDAVYADAAWLARCLAFDLDRRKGGWSHKRLIGVAGSPLNGTDVARLEANNVNYLGDARTDAGVAVIAATQRGVFPSGNAGFGRRIDITTSLDWYAARAQEGLYSVNLQETHQVGYDDDGINRFAAVMDRIHAQGLAAGHFVRRIVPAGDPNEGTETPVANFPTLATVSATDLANGNLPFDTLVYLRGAIERVQMAGEVRLS